MLTDTHSKVFNPVLMYCVHTNTHKQKHDNKVRNTSHTLAQILSCFHLPSAFPSILLILSISLSLTHSVVFYCTTLFPLSLPPFLHLPPPFLALSIIPTPHTYTT